MKPIEIDKPLPQELRASIAAVTKEADWHIVAAKIGAVKGYTLRDLIKGHPVLENHIETVYALIAYAKERSATNKQAEEKRSKLLAKYAA